MSKVKDVDEQEPVDGLSGESKAVARPVPVVSHQTYIDIDYHMEHGDNRQIEFVAKKHGVKPAVVAAIAKGNVMTVPANYVAVRQPTKLSVVPHGFVNLKPIGRCNVCRGKSQFVRYKDGVCFACSVADK